MPLRSALLAKRAPNAVAPRGKALEDDRVRQSPRLIRVRVRVRISSEFKSEFRARKQANRLG